MSKIHWLGIIHQLSTSSLQMKHKKHSMPPQHLTVSFIYRKSEDFSREKTQKIFVENFFFQQKFFEFLKFCKHFNQIFQM